MDKIFSQFNTFYKKLFSRVDNYDVSGIDPSRDWRILLITSQIIIICLISFSVYFYISTNNGNFFNNEISEAKDSAIKIDKTSLVVLVDGINDKTSSLDLIRAGQDIPTDPSI